MLSLHTLMGHWHDYMYLAKLFMYLPIEPSVFYNFHRMLLSYSLLLNSFGNNPLTCVRI